MSLNIAKSNKKRVVIVGGGFGGLKLANKLKKSGFQVVLIDKNNYHQFPASERFLFPYGGSTCHFPGKEYDTDFHRKSRI